LQEERKQDGRYLHVEGGCSEAPSFGRKSGASFLGMGEGEKGGKASCPVYRSKRGEEKGMKEKGDPKPKPPPRAGKKLKDTAPNFERRWKKKGEGSFALVEERKRGRLFHLS